MAYSGTYRTKSGRNTFSFYYEKQSNGEVRAYITSQPSYRGRATGSHSTHRYGVGSRPYVCFGNSPPRDLQSAIKYSKSWAELTERYIETGKDHNAS